MRGQLPQQRMWLGSGPALAAGCAAAVVGCELSGAPTDRPSTFSVLAREGARRIVWQRTGRVDVAHVGIASAAFWGDVMPFVPIALELRRRGHRVTMAVPEGFHDVLADHDLELVHLGTDFSPRELAEHGDVVERSATVRGMRAAMDLWIRQLSIEPAHDIVEVLTAVDPDVWLCHNTMAWLVELQARPAATPLVAGHLFPMMVPTATRMPPMLPGTSAMPAPVCRAAWRLARSMTARMGYDTEVNALRAAYGLPPAHASTGFGWERADRVLVLTSPTYWPVPGDWPDHVEATGLTVWGDVDDDLPSSLREYLADGHPPVLVTLGTSAATNARDAFEMVADAIATRGARSLLLVGNDRNAQRLSHREDVWTFASLPAVLPHVRTVVHAGGHGTTAAALHAGVPQVVMPQTFDQVEHARRLCELEVGARVPWGRRSEPLITAALARVDDDRVRAVASSMATKLATEDGPAAAADRVEVVVARGST